MNRAELKAMAKQQIKGKIGILFLITLIIGLLSGAIAVVLAFIPVVGPILSLFILPAFSLSLIHVYQTVCHYGTPTYQDAFWGFNDFWSAFKVTFLVALFTYLWSLLFIIPGIVKSFSYSMSLYILEENRGMGALECIRRSQAMTNGHKMDLFVLHLSFIGWFLLSYFTLCIALIWVLPYMAATFTNAYNWMKPAPTGTAYGSVSFGTDSSAGSGGSVNGYLNDNEIKWD